MHMKTKGTTRDITPVVFTSLPLVEPSVSELFHERLRSSAAVPRDIASPSNSFSFFISPLSVFPVDLVGVSMFKGVPGCHWQRPHITVWGKPLNNPRWNENWLSRLQLLEVGPFELEAVISVKKQWSSQSPWLWNKTSPWDCFELFTMGNPGWAETPPPWG